MEIGQRVRRLREWRGLTQNELAQFADKSVRWLWGVENGRTTLRIADAEALAIGLRVEVAVVLALVPLPRGLPEDHDLVSAARTLGALGIDPDDVPDQEDVEEAVLRLRRSYSTTPPADLKARTEVRLRQLKTLLGRTPGHAARRDLMAGAAWLALVRGTVLADLSAYEEAETSVRTARRLAQEIGHRDLEAWTWETAAWIAVTTNRHADALELASHGMAVAPIGGHGLVAATMQRARINGAIGREADALEDLAAGRRAWAQAVNGEGPDDHYTLDPTKVAFFASGMYAQLGRADEAIEYAAEVVRANDAPDTRNYWPMRAANARVEWAQALAVKGEEDEAVGMAEMAMDALWWRPDTERRTAALIRRLRDPRLREHLAGRLGEMRIATG